MKSRGLPHSLKIIKLIISYFVSLSLCQGASADPNPQARQGNYRRGLGDGEHYVVKFKPNETEAQLVTKLTKGKIKYELTLSPDDVFEIKTTPTGELKAAIKFKLRETSHTFLVDVAVINESNVFIALTDLPNGYAFVKLKLENNTYVPYLYANLYRVPGLNIHDPSPVKEAGFDSSGNFVVQVDNGDKDVYVIPEDGKSITRNNKAYDNPHIVNRYENANALPEFLRINK